MTKKLFLASALTLVASSVFATNSLSDNSDREININVINNTNSGLSLRLTGENHYSKNIDIKKDDQITVSNKVPQNNSFEYKLVSDRPMAHVLEIMSDMLNSVHQSSREYNLTIAADANPEEIYNSDVSCKMRNKYPPNQEWREWEDCRLS